MSFGKKIVSLILILALMLPFCACRGGDDVGEPAQYGTYGADFARKLVKKYPYRNPYSEGEQGAGNMIKSEFKELGYDVKTQPFSNINGQSSNNYYVKIEGTGFISKDSKSGKVDTKKIVIIGAHYDDSMSATEAALSGYDGISDNASGIGCLMTCAKEIKEYENIGFDVYIVAFGAGNDNYAGARAFYASFDQKERESIEVMFNFDSIYAGDKMYASSGYNSLKLDQKYKMRRKLYQVYDVAYDKELASRNGYSLLYNESGIITDLNGDGVNDIYSEVSANKSDYVVFDEANIPVVYFDSCDYYFKAMEEMKETKNLNLQDYGGTIRGTNLDSSSLLDPILITDESDRLEVRINNTAFVVLETLMKGSDYGFTQAQYNEYLAEKEAEKEAEKQDKKKGKKDSDK